MGFDILTFVYGIILFTIYLTGVILSGKFFRWAYKSDVLPFDMEEVEFFLSLIWCLSIPAYFCFLTVYTFFGTIWLIYDKFV